MDDFVPNRTCFTRPEKDGRLACSLLSDPRLGAFGTRSLRPPVGFTWCLLITTSSTRVAKRRRGPVTQFKIYHEAIQCHACLAGRRLEISSLHAKRITGSKFTILRYSQQDRAKISSHKNTVEHSPSQWTTVSPGSRAKPSRLAADSTTFF